MVAQAGRCRVRGDTLDECSLEALGRAGGGVRFEPVGQEAVQIDVERIVDAHAGPPSCKGSRASASSEARICVLVRLSRDLTVPTGRLRAWAVSCIGSPR